METCVLDAIDCTPGMDLSAHIPCGTRADVEVPPVSLIYDLPGTAGQEGCGRSDVSFSAHYWADDDDKAYRENLANRIIDATDRLQESWDKCTDFSWADAGKATAIGGLYHGVPGAAKGAAAYGIAHAIDHAKDAKDGWDAYHDLVNGLNEWDRLEND
jgi:hypothetical protein